VASVITGKGCVRQYDMTMRDRSKFQLSVDDAVRGGESL